MRIGALAIGLALSWSAIGDARATNVQFTITGGDGTATFELPLSPTPDGPVAAGALFEFLSVPAVVRGSSTTLVDLAFFPAFPGLEEFTGGFADQTFFSFFGPQFYTGPEGAPTFVPGVYTGLLNVSSGRIDTVTVTELSTIPDPPDPPALSVPEPSTWAMLLLGFVGLSYAGYRKAKTRAAPAARRG